MPVRPKSSGQPVEAHGAARQGALGAEAVRASGLERELVPVGFDWIARRLGGEASIGPGGRKLATSRDFQA